MACDKLRSNFLWILRLRRVTLLLLGVAARIVDNSENSRRPMHAFA